MRRPTVPFQATLVQAEDDDRAFVTLPEQVREKLSVSGRTMVEGVVNHFPFRAPLLPEGRLALSEALRKAAGANLGDTVHVELTRVGEEPETRVPADLQEALDAAPAAREAWARTTLMARRDWVLSLLVVKKTETRQGRIGKTCDMLASGKGRVCCFPGINWLTRDHVTRDETWQPLPKP